MSLTKLPINMLQAVGRAGNPLQYNGVNVIVSEDRQDSNDHGVAGGTYDASIGTLTIVLKNGNFLELSGFPTVNTIGKGPAGPTGPAGVDGTDGLNGLEGKQGPTGCRGPEGPMGPAGKEGPMGPYGPTGPQGKEGPTGPAGEDGIVQMWIQSQDPMETAPDHVKAAAIWVKP